MDELRKPLVEALERLTADLITGRYDDPHLAFVVMLHPDRHPTLVSLSPVGAHNFDRLVSGEKDHPTEIPPAPGTEQPFEWRDVADAGRALSDASSAESSFQFRVDKDQTLGQHVDEKLRSRWDRTRDAEFKAHMERAAFEESHQAQCPNCSRRFTERGLAQHQRTSHWEGCRTGTAAPPERRPRRVRVTCPLPRCRWSGLDDAVNDHMATVHAGEYVRG